MMRGDSVDDRIRLAMALYKVCAHDGVRALHFMSQGFADIMKEAGSFGGFTIQAEFRGHQAH